MDKSTLKYFIRFLKEEKLYTPFMNNYKTFNKEPDKRNVLDFLFLVTDYDALNLAYNWWYTDEGKSFWRMMHDKWNLLLKLKEEGKKIYR